LSRAQTARRRQPRVWTDGASGRSSARYAHAEDLLRDADTAMYRAKGSGRGRYVVFDEEMHERALAQLRTRNCPARSD
jgi:predicted signal transduction protein with EAL and GGDEF domain